MIYLARVVFNPVVMAMTDEFDRALEVDILAAALSLDRYESGDLLTLLAQKLTGSLPRNTQIQKSWFGFGAIESITLCFDDYEYQIGRGKYGNITAKSIIFGAIATQQAKSPR
jgi:hypothetical protein